MVGEHLVGEDATRGAAGAHVLGGQGGVQFAERALQPCRRFLGINDSGDEKTTTVMEQKKRMYVQDLKIKR